MSDLPPLREVIARYGLDARRALGQHFLLDLNLTRRIARAAGDLDGRVVIEVGPGPGGLTRALLETDARLVIAIERDRRCVEALTDLQSAYPDRLIIVEADALSLDPAALARERTQEARAPAIVANLPYNVATPLLIRWLAQASAYAHLTLMFQKEVADRLIARPRTPAYGRLSVLTQWLTDATRLFDIGPRAFVPPPKVTSSVVRLVPRAEPRGAAAFADFERITASAFGQRRKMLRSALKTLGVDVAALLAAADIKPDARAEELSVEQFAALAKVLNSIRAG
ncbi:MAG TPA: 16S rRNA (adenine(1518)-N(6)/adenine(1519)-N(6))-dimethyltransferase RsmA [Alphaproteobacteria bacterium]